MKKEVGEMSSRSTMRSYRGRLLVQVLVEATALDLTVRLEALMA